MKNSGSKEPLKILMVAPSLPPMPAGGAEMQALRLAKQLKEKGLHVRFITVGNALNKGRTLVNDIEVYRLHSIFNAIFQRLALIKKTKSKTTVQIEFDDKKEILNAITSKVGWPTWIYYNIFFFHALFYLWIKKKDFDIIHAHTMEWTAIVATRLGKILKKPVLIKDSTMNGFQSLSRFPNGYKIQELIRNNAYLVAMTNVIRKNLINESVPAEKIFHIPNGIDIQKPIQRNEKRNQVLFIGNLYQQPAKGIDILLKAWVGVFKRFKDASLLIIGDGVDEAYIRFVKTLGVGDSVTFLGKVSNVESYFGSSSVFVLPSRREGMSNALMEAMLHAVPCVATDISGNQDIIENEINGLLVPPSDIQSLENAISFMLNNREIAVEMGLKGRKTIIDNYNMEIVTERYMQLYFSVIQKNEAKNGTVS